MTVALQQRPFWKTPTFPVHRQITPVNGTLYIGYNSAPGTYNLGSLSGSGSVADDNASNYTLQIGALNTNTTFSGTINGSHCYVTKTGTGQLTLSGVNSYALGTTINSGQVAMGSYAALGNGKSVTITSGARLTCAATRPSRVAIRNRVLKPDRRRFRRQRRRALLNSAGGGTGWNNGLGQNATISLSGDALFNFATDFGQLGVGYGTTYLNLNSYTLAKSGTGNYYLVNTTVGSGNINVLAGTLNLNKAGGTTGIAIWGFPAAAR